MLYVSCEVVVIGTLDKSALVVFVMLSLTQDIAYLVKVLLHMQVLL